MLGGSFKARLQLRLWSLKDVSELCRHLVGILLRCEKNGHRPFIALEDGRALSDSWAIFGTCHPAGHEASVRSLTWTSFQGFNLAYLAILTKVVWWAF